LCKRRINHGGFMETPTIYPGKQEKTPKFFCELKEPWKYVT